MKKYKLRNWVKVSLLLLFLESAFILYLFYCVERFTNLGY